MQHKLLESKGIYLAIFNIYVKEIFIGSDITVDQS